MEGIEGMRIPFLCALIACGVAALSPIQGAGSNSPVVITCLGDSVTEGVGSSGEGATYPARMAAALQSTFPSMSFDVRNRGVGGYRAEDVIAYLNGPDSLAEDPAYVLLMIGGNDLASATIWNITAIVDETVAEVQQCVNLIKAHANPDGAPPAVIVSTFIPNLLLGTWGSEAIDYYNDALLDTGRLSGYDLIITSNWEDFYDTTTGSAIIALMADPVHPNDDGYSLMAHNWVDALTTFIAPGPTPAPTATPAPGYIALDASPPIVIPGGTVTLSYGCDFSAYNYRGRPVDIYLAVLKNPSRTGPSSVAELFNAETVYIFESGMKDIYAYEGAVRGPTWSRVSFPPAALSGSIAIRVPEHGFAGAYAFAILFLYSDTGQYVRTDSTPAVISDRFLIP